MFPQGKEHLRKRTVAHPILHDFVPESWSSLRAGFRKLEDLLVKGRKFDLKPNRTCTRGFEMHYPLHSHADLHWTVSKKYTPERENTFLLNFARAKCSMHVIRWNDAGYKNVCTSTKIKYSSIFNTGKTLETYSHRSWYWSLTVLFEPDAAAHWPWVLYRRSTKVVLPGQHSC